VKQIAVYAASSELVPQPYFEATRTIGKELAKAAIKVIYGGGGTGLMGELADSILANNGYVKGIIPEFMIEVEWQHQDLTELEVVQTMSERKMKFLDQTDAILALPGGTGTIEELLEVITLKRLSKFQGRIVILNYKGYYDPLLAMLNRCIEEDFMSAEHRKIWDVINEPLDLISVLNNGENWNVNHIREAKLKR